MAEMNVHMPCVMRDVTLDIAVTGQRQARLRLWLGTKLLLLAALVIGCDVDVSIKSDG